MNKTTIIFLLFALFCSWILLVDSKKPDSKTGVVKPEEVMDGIIELDDKSFTEVVNGKQHILVEFYAPWCTYWFGVVCFLLVKKSYF